MQCETEEMGSAGRTIRSFIIIDLETTGLPIFDRKVKITEMVMVGALREHLFELSGNVDGPHLPRVLPKLNLYAYPRKAIHPKSTDITGLSNELLENVNPFDEQLVSMIDGFIQRLPPPVCLIAHNGNRFDFPVLQAELNHIGKALPDHLLCADSLPALREILQSKETIKCDGDKDTRKTVEGIRPLENCAEEDYKRNFESAIYSDGYDEALYKTAESLEKANHNSILSSKLYSAVNYTSSTSAGEINQVPSNSDGEKLDVQNGLQDLQILKKRLETTPKQTTKAQNSKPMQQTVNVVTPTSNSNKIDQQRPHNPKARKRLFSSEKGSDNSTPKSFKLGDLYQFLRRKEALDAHHAESDCLNLLECIVAVGPQFLDWADKNAVEFKQLKKMW